MKEIDFQIKKMKEDFLNGKPMTFIGFWGNHNDTPEEASFSNFHQTKILYDVHLDTSLRSVKTVQFSSSEQFFMYKKAVHFNDFDSVHKILEPGHSAYHYKKLGREVENFNEDEWSKVRYGYMLEALWLKYTQNAKLQDILLNTKDAILVETSPFDKVWGVGLAKKSKEGNPQKDWRNPLKWRGENLLGFALMETREKLKKEDK